MTKINVCSFSKALPLPTQVTNQLLPSIFRENIIGSRLWLDLSPSPTPHNICEYAMKTTCTRIIYTRPQTLTEIIRLAASAILQKITTKNFHNFLHIFHSCSVHQDIIKSFIYSLNAQLNCSKRMLKLTLKFTLKALLHVSV
jgi:hypothetical protein